jgi:hypothetical protein
MSLINDALKRVKEAQHKAPPSADIGPQLRPVEPAAVPARHGLGWLLPFALTAVALLTLLLLWELARKENPLVIRAQPPAQEGSSTANQSPQSPAPSVETTPSVHEASATPAETHVASLPSLAQSNSAASTKGSPVAEAAGNINPGAIQLAQGASTNTPDAEVQPPKPAPLRLQGIVFSKRPSAVISGKTVFVGDRVREFRVVSITQDTAILVGGGQTNALSLSE